MRAVTITPVTTKAQKKAFIDLGYSINAHDPHFVPPLRMDMNEMLNTKKNPFFEHAEMQLFLAHAGGRVVGRISAHIDFLAHTVSPEQGMGPGTGFWGLFEAEDEPVAKALMAAAEDWLRAKGMTHVLGPVSLSVWDQPGLMVYGFEEDPIFLMGHNLPQYQPWVEGNGYELVKSLLTYHLDITTGFPPLIQRVVAAGEKNARITIREADPARFEEEAALIFSILNDAWSDNWGFVPITDREIQIIAKKMKPVVYGNLIRIAEVDGEPVAFMMTFPDMNPVIKPFNGKLFPFNWLKLLSWTKKPTANRMRVPLMGVVKRLQSSRLASQLAFMMIEYIRRVGIADYQGKTGEIGWILEDNQGMIAIADAIESKVNKQYNIYRKAL